MYASVVLLFGWNHVVHFVHFLLQVKIRMVLGLFSEQLIPYATAWKQLETRTIKVKTKKLVLEKKHPCKGQVGHLTEEKQMWTLAAARFSLHQRFVTLKIIFKKRKKNVRNTNRTVKTIRLRMWKTQTERRKRRQDANDTQVRWSTGISSCSDRW